MKIRFAVAWPLAAATGLLVGAAMLEFFKFVAANGIEDWQVAGLFLAFTAGCGIAADRLIRRPDRSGDRR